MRLTEKAFTELLDTLAAATPTPGGGSASALAASVGLALLEMVSAMTRTRTGNDESRRALDQFFNPGTRRAFVASHDGVFGMARMYSLHAESLGQTIEVFRDLEPAHAWIEA